MLILLASPSSPADGRYVAFQSDASNLVSSDTNLATDIFVHDRQTGQTTRVSVASDSSEGNDVSYKPTISADGRYVAFQSYASNLVSGDTNGTGMTSFMTDKQGRPRVFRSPLMAQREMVCPPTPPSPPMGVMLHFTLMPVT
ncbi:MAG: PD40 domain-containing protein [Ardenticatenaceae bacterium]|nr:PD40 domain-containing protein [Ardenticatenaceae bacterium]